MMAVHDSLPTMSAKTDTTAITERGQTSIPAELRRALGLQPGMRLSWEAVSDTEIRLHVLRTPVAADPVAMLGFARRFRASRRTADWMKELREGDD